MAAKQASLEMKRVKETGGAYDFMEEKNEVNRDAEIRTATRERK
jgi:hypothetical protein